MPAVTSIVQLSDVKAHLNIGSTSNDVELQGFIDGATPVIELVVGDVVGHTYTEWHEGGSDTVIVHRHPVLTVTSVTEYVGTVSYPLTEQSPDSGNPIDAFGYFVDYDAGLIQRTAYGVPSWFSSLPWWTARTPAWFTGAPSRLGHGSGRVKVVYGTGRTSVPANIRLAACELIRENWQPTQQGYVPAFGNGETGELPPAGANVGGYILSPRVMQLLAPHARSTKVVGR